MIKTSLENDNSLNLSVKEIAKHSLKVDSKNDGAIH
jgi:hypothetical protein